MFLDFQRASLKKQQILITIIVTLSVFIAVFLAIHASLQIQQQSSVLLPSQLPWQIFLASLVAILVGGFTFALELITINQMERGFNQIQLELRALGSGDFNPSTHLESLALPKEMREVGSYFPHLKLALSTSLSELQQKLEEQGTIRESLQAELTGLENTLAEQKLSNEGLQSRLIRIQQALEEALEENQALARKVSQKRAEVEQPEGEVGDFIAQMQGEFQQAPKSVASLTSSSLEEIVQYKEELEYRITWLRTLLEDAEKELKLICITYEL
jgi:hypothetical protein